MKLLNAQAIKSHIEALTGDVWSLPTIYGWLARGMIRSRRLGGRRWVQFEDLESFLLERGILPGRRVSNA